MIITDHITFNKDIKEALFSSLALSFGFSGNSHYLYAVGFELYKNSILNDLEKMILQAKNPIVFNVLFKLIKDLEEKEIKQKDHIKIKKEKIKKWLKHLNY